LRIIPGFRLDEPRRSGSRIASRPPLSPRPPSARIRRLLIWAVVAVLAAALALAFPASRWRVAVIGFKVLGQLPAVDWVELVQMEQPNSPFPLHQLAAFRDPYRVITNPFDTAADREQGGRLFAARCAQCHGASAGGGVGPALVGRVLRHGDSDWAIYQTIGKGVPGTAMPPAPLARDDVWRVIGHLHALRDRARPIHGGEASLGAAPDTGPAQLLAAAGQPGDWALPSGTYDARRFSADAQINAANVAQLGVKWIHQFDAAGTPIESVPIVVGRYMYVTLPRGPVVALDARTGTKIWEFTRPSPADLRLCCIDTNRGVSVLGQRVYVATLDAHLIALDATTGKPIWDQTVANYQQGFSITSAPLPVGDTVVTGIAGGDFPVRGFITAYDAASGALKWRFHTIPEPGEAGHDSWGGDDNALKGGASTWNTGSYDPQLGLIYWGTGNPAPDYNAAVRPGDNLYSNSVVALDAKTGALRWHFQYTPGDDHDWDSVQTPILVDVERDGVTHKLLEVANRNGFFYVLDRVTGRFERAGPYVKQTWAKGIDATGRPLRTGQSTPTPGGTFVYPSVTGATNFWPAAYSQASQLYYVMALERGGLFFASEAPPKANPGHLFTGGAGQFADGDERYTAIKAIDPATATVRWEHRNLTYNDAPRGGLLATAGGLVFGSDTSNFIALDAGSGAVVWNFPTGGTISAAPVTFRDREQQVVAVIAGQVLIAFQLPAEAAHPAAAPKLAAR